MEYGVLPAHKRVSEADGCRCGRRQFLKGLVGAGAGLLSPSPIDRAFAGGAAAKPSRLDLHHHYASPKWIERLAGSRREGAGAFRNGYDPKRDIEMMDKGGVVTAFLSVTTPGIWLSDDIATERTEVLALARDMNEYGAGLASDYKGRFGLFAVLPLPDIDASLREIEYAFDTLHADGAGLLTSYGNHWLGDKLFEPVFEELNRRRAVVYVHPTDAPCCRDLANSPPGELEWLTDTARSIMSMISGDPSPASRYPDIKFIWSHAGGSLVGVASRVVGTFRDPDYLLHPPAPNSRLHQVRRFYYDTAGSADPLLMPAITKLAGASQLVFGSDYPFGDPRAVVERLRFCGFSDEELRGIDCNNAMRILPSYSGANSLSTGGPTK